MPLTYRRPDKLSHADTIRYEIFMLRFAAARLVEGKWQEEKDAWVYLEAFLLHYRNMIEFLGKEGPRPTDLHVTTIWALENLAPPPSLNDIHKKGTVLSKRYEPSDADGGGRISQYLQHCTMKRIDFKEWRIDEMSAEIEPLVAEIEQYLKPSSDFLKVVPAVVFLGPHSASTATATYTASQVMSNENPVTKPRLG